MGPTSRAPLPAGTAAGKAPGEVMNAQRANAPTRCDRGERLQNEGSATQMRMRDDQPPRFEFPATPKHDVEVNDTRTPTAPSAAAELTLETFQARQHRRGFDVTLDERDGIGEIASGASMRGIENDGRGVEQSELFIEPGNGGFHDPGRTPEAAVRTVRSNRDRVELR